MIKHTRILLISLLIGAVIAAAGCADRSSLTDPEQSQSTQDNEAAESESTGESAGETETNSETEALSEEAHDDLEAFQAFSDLITKSSDIKNLYYEFELRVEGVSRAYYTAWKNEDQFRIDTFDQVHSIYANLEDQTVFVLDRSTGVISPSVYDPAFFNEKMSPVAFNEALEQDMFEHVHFEGSALMDGKPCDVYEVHSADLNVTYYLWKDNGLTVKMIAQITGFPSYEYYFRSLQPEGATPEALTPPDDKTVSVELVTLPVLTVGQ